MITAVGAVVLFALVLTYPRKIAREPRPPPDVPVKPHREAEEHAVLIRVKLSDEGFGTPAERQVLHGIADKLERAVKSSKAGEYDGDELGRGHCTLFLYGRDADKLFDVVAPILRTHAATQHAVVTKRYGAAGNPDVREVKVRL